MFQTLHSIIEIHGLILKPWQNGPHFEESISKLIFWNGGYCIFIQMSLKFVSKGPIYNNPSLVQVMAWRWTDDKPLSELNLGYLIDAYMCHSALMS